MRGAISSFQQLVTLAPHLPAELSSAAGAIEDPLHLAYYIANHIRLTTEQRQEILEDRKSTRLNSSHQIISYAVFCLKKKKILKSPEKCSTRIKRPPLPNDLLLHV